MAVLPWSRPYTMYPGTFIAEVVQLPVSCKALKTGKSCRICGVCVASRPTTHSTNHLFSRLRLIVQNEPRSRACPPASHVVQKGLQRVDIRPRGRTLKKNSRLNTQFAPMVMQATCDNTAKLPGGALLTDTRIPVVTHRMSNCSFVRPAFSRVVHRKIACVLFQGLLSGAVSSVALTRRTVLIQGVYSASEKSLCKTFSSIKAFWVLLSPLCFNGQPHQCLLEVQLNTFSVLRSDPSLNHRKVIILKPKFP